MDDSTRDYYEQEAQRFFDATVNIDPTPILTPLAEALLPGARILDIGCGSGRDLLWLKERGFYPHGLEPSPALAALAETHSGCPVTVGELTTTDFLDRPWDGILVSGVLVHLPHGTVPGHLLRLAGALADGGRLYVSVKEGKGEGTDADDRSFYYWQDDDFRQVAQGAGLSVLSMSRSASARGNADIWLGYLLKAEGGTS
ncbi:class I SAM-dependent methyltransferase [Desulfoluna butyratoxydans]|uniref:S-adenosyl-l-methionine-dependent methyltransferase n=1 Tax=Desulfoluna butyratoxydans TaxID=231438 RepID=A0A4U8YKH5_9BACT|nr:class I SAM-dependent methyltransferase [Desulfoluna butyratoxydans]VFQ43599.1 s-adenosyl-l-methionine-dependent methyltransferase [Desulfoluna butyratoxydans]